MAKAMRLAFLLPAVLADVPDAPILAVAPSWTTTTSVDDNQGYVAGTMQVTFVWKDSGGSSNPMSFMNAVNLIDGTSARVQSSTLNQQFPAYNGTGSDTLTTATTLFVGRFKQSVDDTCFPFERKTAKFLLSLFPPGPHSFNLRLYCDESGGDAKTTLPASETRLPGYLSYLFAEKTNAEVIESCSKDLGHTLAAGIYWDSWSCRIEGSKVLCEAVGDRNSEPIERMYLMPVVFFACIGFVSFAFPPKLAMPRVASTMIALLTLSGYKIQVLKVVSNTSESALVSFFNGLIVLLFLAMLSHVIAIAFDGHGHSRYTQPIIDNVVLFVVPPVFMFAFACHLLDLGCAGQISAGTFWALIIVSVVWTLIDVIVVYLLHVHRLRKWEAEDKAKAEAAAASAPAAVPVGIAYEKLPAEETDKSAVKPTPAATSAEPPSMA